MAWGVEARLPTQKGRIDPQDKRIGHKSGCAQPQKAKVVSTIGVGWGQISSTTVFCPSCLETTVLINT